MDQIREKIGPMHMIDYKYNPIVTFYQWRRKESNQINCQYKNKNKIRSSISSSRIFARFFCLPSKAFISLLSSFTQYQFVNIYSLIETSPVTKAFFICLRLGNSLFTHRSCTFLFSSSLSLNHVCVCVSCVALLNVTSLQDEPRTHINDDDNNNKYPNRRSTHGERSLFSFHRFD